MAFNFQQIKRLATIYRSIEQALTEVPDSPLDQARQFYAHRIFAAIDDYPFRLTYQIQNHVRRFPRPKFAIGSVVSCEYEGDRHPGLVCGLAYHSSNFPDSFPEPLPLGWWYYVELFHYVSGYNSFHEHTLHLSSLSEYPIPDLDDQQQADLEEFLAQFEQDNGSLFPYQEVN
ncbi:MAG: hypothetical protein J7540_07855 [Roseofilum sp. SID2]|uniref:hypothetical protein n=1 Tax=unclassified Roseofilum TaxID=2620099 RepID=UPI001B22956E|nr:MULTISPECIES: hypothetical protein [unclassified Roseofilum]MBP0011780.1 hypothetical protein [Roseofilum sp. SID3]MBP0023894.1 hypothetical protein [Roseofilum sp. SID2]